MTTVTIVCPGSEAVNPFDHPFIAQLKRRQRGVEDELLFLSISPSIDVPLTLYIGGATFLATTRPFKRGHFSPMKDFIRTSVSPVGRPR